MKRNLKLLTIGIIFSICIGCQTTFKEPLIITRVSRCKDCSQDSKYYLNLNNEYDIFIFTDELYSVGDTLKIIRKK